MCKGRGRPESAKFKFQGQDFRVKGSGFRGLSLIVQKIWIVFGLTISKAQGPLKKMCAAPPPKHDQVVGNLREIAILWKPPYTCMRPCTIPSLTEDFQNPSVASLVAIVGM